jgi:UPF0755 protein
MVKRGKAGFSLFKGLTLVFILSLLALTLLYLLTTKSKAQSQAVTGLEVDPASGEVLYEVPPKVSLSSLAQDLESKGLISHKFLFKSFLRISRQDKKIRAGYFYIKPSNSILEMAWKLTSGKMATRVVTIPEGKTSWEIYSILAAHFPLDSLKFDSLVNSPSFAQSCRVEARSLEGFLFPDTYVLPWKISERGVLIIMVNRFREVVAGFRLDSPMYAKYGLKGWLTLASIVEKEAAVPSEQELIAGVFYNRLVQGWTLGADPTVRFAIRKMTGPLYVSELDGDSPYNTRKFPGLPPGPICNPGKGALRASLNPVATEKMFFVAKDDGSREHFFSVDNPEHMRYKGVAASNRRKRGLEKPQARAEQAIPKDSARGKPKPIPLPRARKRA